MQYMKHQEIYNTLPHKKPIALLEDANFEDDKNIICSMTPSSKDELAASHFESNPVVPGTYLIEAMAQAAALLLMISTDNTDKIPYLIGISNMRFLSAASFDRKITIKATLSGALNGMADFKLSAFQNDIRIASGQLSLFMN